MTYAKFISEYAQRLGISSGSAQFLADELCEEIVRQLILDEEVSLPKLGKFSAVVPKMTSRVSNLPGMRGKLDLAKTRKRLGFRSYRSANAALTRRSFLSMVQGSGTAMSDTKRKARKEAMVAKAKEGEHCVVEVPAGVRQITINLADKEKRGRKKKKGSSESKATRETLLG